MASPRARGDPPVPVQQSEEAISSASVPQNALLPPHVEISKEYNFIKADAIVSWKRKTMPSFRELARSHPEMVVRQRVTLSAVLYGELVETHGTVSHRWMEQGAPDAEGVQLAALQEMLRQTPRLKYIWVDDWCMWQG